MSTAPLKTTALMETAKTSAGRLTIVGFGLGILGMIAMASPLVVGVSVSILVGVLLAAGGLGQSLFALQSETGTKRIAYLMFGTLSVVCGVLMISQPIFGLKFMTVLLIVFFLTSGVSQFFHALQIRPLRGWGWILSSGLVSLLFAILIWRNWPLSGAWAIGVLVGVKLLFCGVAFAVVGIAARTMIHEEQASLLGSSRIYERSA